MNARRKKIVLVGMSPKKSLRDSTGQAGGIKKKPLVFVGMSGGVDSSVAAALLKKRGFQVVGAHMRCSSEQEACAANDEADAHRVAAILKIPFYTFDFEKEYEREVVRYMVEGYKKGITPNPDVICNREIKFGLFLKTALSWGADYVATGHYVRKKTTGGISKLYVAKDTNKDQSYFLWTLNQKQLWHSLFPIGDYVKSDVRKIAATFGLPTAAKKDSQGICFLGKVSIDQFLKSRIPVAAGPIFDGEGKQLGTHEGAELYTIGQRHGLHIGGTGPYFVVRKDVRNNIVYVGKENAEERFAKSFGVKNVNWISEQAPQFPLQAMCRVRYRALLHRAALQKKKGAYHVTLRTAERGVAEGQSVVFYRGREMLGGGIIVNSL